MDSKVELYVSNANRGADWDLHLDNMRVNQSIFPDLGPALFGIRRYSGCVIWRLELHIECTRGVGEAIEFTCHVRVSKAKSALGGLDYPVREVSRHSSDPSNRGMHA